MNILKKVRIHRYHSCMCLCRQSSFAFQNLINLLLSPTTETVKDDCSASISIVKDWILIVLSDASMCCKYTPYALNIVMMFEMMNLLGFYFHISHPIFLFYASTCLGKYATLKWVSIAQFIFIKKLRREDDFKHG